MRALKKQIGKAERAVRVLIRNQRKDDHGEDNTSSINSTANSNTNRSRPNSTEDATVTGSGGGPLKVKLHIKMADFHSEATALVTPPTPTTTIENDVTPTITTVNDEAETKVDVDVVGVDKGATDEKQQTEENQQQGTTNTPKGKKNNKSRRRKGTLTTRSSRRKAKDDSTVTTNTSTVPTKQPTPATTNTSSRRKRSKYYVYADELYAAAATQQKKPLYDASSLGSAVSLSKVDLDPSLSPSSALSPETDVDFTMISSEVDFDIEFDYDMRPAEEVYLTTDDILASLQSLAEDSLSDEAARQMEKACQERLSKVCIPG